MAQICLIRTEGKTFTDGPTLSPARFVDLPSLSRESKTQTARLTESAFDLGDCLYFYGGHACPDFGDVVLLYDSHMADREKTGSATPFDTGGLHEGHVNAPSLAASERAAYCLAHCKPLDCWFAEAEAYIQKHFESDSAYVLGDRPVKDDPTGRLFHPDNSRRAWTWEVRLHRDHELTEALIRIWMSADYFEAVRQLLLIAPNSHQKCQYLVQNKTVRSTPSGDSPHAHAEEEVSIWL